MAITTGGAGNWSSTTPNAPWPGGTLPTAADADDVTIAHAVVLDTATAVCDSLIIAAGGTLSVDGTVDTKLVIDNGITVNNSATAFLNLDMSAAPTKKCEIYWNNNNTATADANTTVDIQGKFMLKGAQKTEQTTATDALTGGTTTSVHVADATGWREGDKLVFCTTQAYDATALTITSTSWSGGSLTCNVASTTGFVVGENVMFAGFNVAALNVNQVIATVAATSFTIVVADPGATSGTRTATKMPRTDAVTISVGGITYDSGSTGPATVTWSDGKGAGGSVAHDHADNCLVGNFTRNLILGPATAGNVACLKLRTGSNAGSALINDVEFRSMGALATFSFSGVVYIFSTNSSIAGINRCAFWDWGRQTGTPGPAIYWDSAINVIPRSGNLFYSTRVSAPLHTMSGVLSAIGDETDMAVFRATIGPTTLAPGLQYITPKISGLTSTNSNAPGGFTIASFGDCLVSGGGVWSSYTVAGLTATGGGAVTFDGTWLGEGFSGSTYSSATNGGLCNPRGSTNVTFNSCPENVSSRFNQSATSSATTRVTFLNRDNSSVNQDIYSPVVSITTPVWSRTDTAGEFYRATSGMKVTTLGSSTTFEQGFPIPVKGGVAATILLYVKKNAAYNDAGYALPSATISGLGITPITAAGTNVDDTWELLDLSYASGAAPANDGTLTLTLSAQSSTATGIAYFSGIPIAPFVSRVRHYGYIFDETSPTRTADITKSESFATADAYTDFTFSWSATVGSSTTTISADTTFQKLYDGHQAEAVQNVGSAVALTGAGVAGSPALFASGNVTLNTTKTLNGAGSLSIPSGKTLTADVPWAFTYTNGTYSKADASANATFAGGTLTIGANGTYTFTQASAMILSMTPTAPGTYALGGNTFTGQVDLRNTSGTHAITVELPTGTSYTTANNTGAAITISTPQLYQSVTVGGIAATYRIQIFDLEYVFTVSGVTVTPTAGATYTNNGITYTVRSTNITAGSGTVICWGTAAPAASGTLTKASGTGDATLTFSAYVVDGTELYIGVPGATSYTWTDGTAAADTRVIRVRIMEDGPGTADAIIMIDKIVGTCGTTDGAEALSYLATSDIEADDIYNDRGVDGSAITGITIDDTTLRLEIASGTITNYNGTDVLVVDGRDLYAYETYWLGTTAGMRDEARFIEAVDAVNFRCSNFKLKGTSGYPIMINNCFIVDAATGIFSSMVDYSGDPISNHPEHMKAIVVTTSDSVVTGTLAEFIAAVPTATAIATEVVTGITF